MLGSAAVLIVALGAALAVSPSPASAFPYSEVDFSGHGWGHGMGMGQWGALGYAIGQDNGAGNFTWQQIIEHYYGTLTSPVDGSTATAIAPLPHSQSDTGSMITVAITEDLGDVIVTSQQPFSVTAGATTYQEAAGTGVRFQLVANTDTWNFETSPGCGGPWSSPIGPAVVGPKATPDTPAPFPTSESTATLDNQAMQLCLSPQSLYFRGSIAGTVNSINQPRTVNVLPLQQYLADVTPSESPTSWYTLGGPDPNAPAGYDWGFEALEAQAVAARSYAMAPYGSSPTTGDLQGWFGYADICDSTACQYYPGVQNENTVTDAAVTDTANDAVTSQDGQVTMSTQYSSSTGGYSAGGTFAAVVDAGDAVSYNSHHDWTAQIPVSTIEGAYPQIGTLESINVTSRNGLGDMGGRVLDLTLDGSSGTASMTGSYFAGQFGLQSDWFTVTNETSGNVSGYYVAATDGGVFAYGSAQFYGSMGGHQLNAPMVGMASLPNGSGYWLDASDGGIFAFGNAPFYGSMGGHHLNAPVVGMAATPDGKGYWLVASDGGIFAYGDAPFEGSMGGKPLNEPVVGMAATSDGKGYWLVASDGGIFAFGSAQFHGSMGGHPLNKPVVGMAATSDGGGYWLVGSDGGIFAFGDAQYYGSLPGEGVTDTVVSIMATGDNGGYLIVSGPGNVYPFGDAPQFGEPSSAKPTHPMVGGATVLVG
ncbi:MAG: SpoIID/LytB domain-containing protein [Acidimicrobiales bacterium]